MSKPNNTHRRNRNKKNEKKIALITALLVVLIIVVGVAVYFNNKGKDEVTENNGNEVHNEKLVLQTEKLDKSALKSFIKDIESFDEQEFTEESYENMEKVVKSAKKTLRKFKPTQNEIDIAFANLVQAVQDLKYKD